MEINDDELDFAYKYPFSSEAKKIADVIGSERVEERFLNAGRIRVQEALKNERLEFTSVNHKELKLTYLVSYIYARMMVSALSNQYLIPTYAEAESKRIGEALISDTDENMLRLAAELGFEMKISNGLVEIPFYRYVNNTPRDAAYALVHQKLNNGFVYVTRNKAARVLQEAARAQILKGLPIATRSLPKVVMEYAKRIEIPRSRITVMRSGKSSWIDKLLDTPIRDCRHRVVNLILAPYLVNVRGLDQKEASERIIDYIKRCKMLDPNTNISDAYVRYQCAYSKRRGLKPYSLEKAKLLLTGTVDLDVLTGGAGRVVKKNG